jgi:CRP/FNR family cyclic AMP-dependent transcriptional regulator
VERDDLELPAASLNGASACGFRCLLDLDVDLADELDLEVRRVARAAATTLTFETGTGELRLSQLLRRANGGPGLLALDGVLSGEVRVGDRIAAELLGPGDLLQPIDHEGDQLLSSDVRWRVLLPMRFALLDGAFARRVRFWPQISRALLRRTATRVQNLNLQRAIAAQPRLEVRLALLLWHLASRWGKVERGGIRLELPLTHHLLGQLIGAERPSVSHALARLAHSGLVTGHGDEWHLHGSLEDRLSTIFETPSRSAQQMVAAVVSIRPQ